MTEDVSVRATSFGGVAEDYDRYRPSPPVEAADWILPTDARLVVDVCAGTGGFSRVLAGRAERVVAVELDLRMVILLAQRSDGVLPVCGKGEVLPLRASSADAMLVSSAWHWLDAGLALREASRLLRPGGVLGVVWSGPRRDIDWVAEIMGQSGPGRARYGRTLELVEGMDLARPENCAIDWSLLRTPDELVGLAGTYSRVITGTPAERSEVSRQAERVALERSGLRDDGRIELPMRTYCWKAERLSP